MEPIDLDLDENELELPSEPMHLNLGPSHPAMHGTVRIVLELSGETIMKSDVQIGYLHRGFEKMCERGTWTQVFPYVDLLNYVSPMLNNVGYALAVEKMCEIEVPDRCQWYRMILGELARMSDGYQPKTWSMAPGTINQWGGPPPARFLLTGFPIARPQPGRPAWAMRPERGMVTA